MLLQFDVRKLELTNPETKEYTQITQRRNMPARHTAVILCDMWQDHWCRGAARRTAEMAPRMNRVVKCLREQGVTIAHAPSGTMDFYRDHPARIRTLQEAEGVEVPEIPEAQALRDREPPLYIDREALECDCALGRENKCKFRPAWYRQIETLEICDGDLIGDGLELLRAFRARGIEHVIIMGVHTNCCVLGREFGIRSMVTRGFDVMLMRDLTDCMAPRDEIPYTDHFTDLDLVVWHIEKYWCGTVTSDQVLHDGVYFRFAEDTRKEMLPYRNYHIVPTTDIHWQKVQDYIEPIPNPDYSQASDAAVEAFRDMKYCVRIHWGLYSMLHLNGESWKYLSMSYEEKQKYGQLYRSFNPTAFDAEEWMQFFERAGFRGFMFTAKHHEGFSMYDTKTRVHKRVNWTAENGPELEDCNLAYSVMETPFGRDIVKELCDAGHRHNMKIDLYFSHPDWYDADFRPYNYHPCNTLDMEDLMIPQDLAERKPEDPRMDAPALTGEEKQRMLARHREQMRELLTKYGKIDMMCLDQWFGPKIWPELRETVKMARQLQPDVMLRCRGIGSYGDYYTPEGFVPGARENTGMPWMVIHGLGESFSYDAQGEHYRSPKWVVHTLLDTISKGGNFMVGIGPDEYGLFHPQAVRVLEEAGAWVRLHAKGIYGTRERAADLYREGDHVVYTQAREGGKVYAYTLEWPGDTLTLTKVRPAAGSKIFMTGCPQALDCTWADGRLTIRIPERFQQEVNRPCQYAWCFEIESEI